MGSTITELATGVGDLVTGNFGGALQSVLGLFDGHSVYYKADQALAAGNWQAAATFYIDLYTNPQDNDKYGAGFNGYLKGPFSSGAANKFTGLRYTAIPLIYKNTQNPAILQMYQLAVQQGLIPADPTISSSTTVAQAAAVNMATATALPGVPAPVPGAAVATNTSTYIIAAVIAVVIIIIIIVLIK